MTPYREPTTAEVVAAKRAFAKEVRADAASIGQNRSQQIEWRKDRDLSAGHATVAEAIERSPYRAAFQETVAAFVAKASSHERVRIQWWHAPYVYVTVL